MSSSSRFPRYALLVLILTATLLVILQRWGFASRQQYIDVEPTKQLDEGCQMPEGPRFRGQSGEDKAVFSRYFATPLVCHGTFVELGALDGLRYSNTKFFEDNLGWTGVLIEAEPNNAKNMMINRPKTKNFAMAVCPEGQKTAKFAGGGAVGGIKEHMTEQHKKAYIHSNTKTIEVPCEPMGTILKKAGIKKIDLFSLDVEGGELMVLQTMDWSIPVRVFVIEMGHGSDDQLINFLSEHGYKKAPWNIRDHCPPGGDCAPNVVFENTNWPPARVSV